MSRSQPSTTKAASFTLLLVVGWGTGLAAVVLHSFWWGLLLAAAASLGMLVALDNPWWSRLPFGLGWVLCVGGFVVTSRETEFLVSGDANGYALMGLGLLVLVVSIATVDRPGRVHHEGVDTPT